VRVLLIPRECLRTTTIRNRYVTDWHGRRRDELAGLLARGVVPYVHDMEQSAAAGGDWSFTDTIGLSFSQVCHPPLT
jgi:hypothetical protein